MKDILQGIADYTAKGIYLVIRFYGTATYQDFYEAGYKQSTLFHGLKLLVNGGFIERVGKGAYRVATSSGLEVHRSPLEIPQTSSPLEVHRSIPEVQHAGQEDSGQKRQRQTSSRLRSTSSPSEVHRSIPEVPPDSVNVVNNVNNINKLTSTEEILPRLRALREHDLEASQRFNKKCLVIKQLLDMKQLSDDIIVRIVVSEMWLPNPITLELINKWRKEAVSAQLRGNVKEMWMAVASNVKQFYVKQGVKWTRCRPNNVREIDKELRTIGDVLKGLTVSYPNGKTESAAELISLKECDNMEKYVKGKVQ